MPSTNLRDQFQLGFSGKKKKILFIIFTTLFPERCHPRAALQFLDRINAEELVINMYFFFLEIQLCCKRITEGVIWWKSVAKISKSRFVIREFLDYLKWVRNHRILSCFKAVCALCGWGVDAWHGSSRESRHRQDVGLCAFVVERGKKTTPVSCPPLYSPGKADILKVSGRRPVWIRLDRNSETDRGLYTYRQFTERIVYLRVCVAEQRGGLSCLS